MWTLREENIGYLHGPLKWAKQLMVPWAEFQSMGYNLLTETVTVNRLVKLIYRGGQPKAIVSVKFYNRGGFPNATNSVNILTDVVRL